MLVSWTDGLSRLLAVILLIAINAFFVAAEFSILSVRRSRINQLVSTGDVQAETVQLLQRQIERLLSTTQLGITLSSLALGWIGEGTLVILVRSSLNFFPISNDLKNEIANSLTISLVSFCLLAYLQIVLGELVPKSVAWVYAEKISKLLGSSSLAIARFFHPFVSVLNYSTRWLLRLFNIPLTVLHPPISSEELQLIIQTSSESTGLENQERQLLNNVFEFTTISAQEIMIPRSNMITVSQTATFQTLLDEMAKSGHSRYPMIENSLDNILGIIDFKQLAKPLAQGLISPQTPLYPWVKPVRFVPEAMRLGELLVFMEECQQSLIMVVDEYGGIAGLVTLQDLIDKLISPVSERGNLSETLAIQILDSVTFLVQAQLNLEVLNDRLNLQLPLGDDYQTLGGFLINEMQKIPTVGESLIYQSLEFTIISTSGARLDQIRIHVLGSSPY